MPFHGKEWVSPIEAAKAAISMLDSLRVRALSVVDEAPYWKFVSEPDFARLEFDGEDAVLTLCEAEMAWDSPTLGIEVVRFQAGLLFIEQGELDAWKAEQQAIYDQKQALLKTQRIANIEANERAALKALQAKYGHAR